MKVQQFEQDILESLGAKVTDAGVVLNPMTEEPYQIGGKDIVIPTKHYLDQNDWSEVHPFHPLCEDVMMGQSETYHFMLRLWRANTTVRFMTLITAILEVANDPKLAKEVKNPEFAKLPIPNVKDTTLKAWKKLRGHFKKEHFLKLYVSRSEDIDGTKYLRRADLNIPFLETEGGKPFGLQISIADANTLRELVKHLFEPILKPHGSNHAIPYTDVLLQVQKATAEQYNKYADMLSKVHSLPLIPLEWLSAYDDMDKFRRHIPKLPGNEGTKLDTGAKTRQTGVEPEADLYSQANVARKPQVERAVDDEPPFEPDTVRRRRDDKASGSGRVSLNDMMRDPEDLRDDRDDRGRGRGRRDDRRGGIDLLDRRSRRRDDRDDRGRGRGRRDDRRGGGGFRLGDLNI